MVISVILIVSESWLYMFIYVYLYICIPGWAYVFMCAFYARVFRAVHTET